MSISSNPITGRSVIGCLSGRGKFSPVERRSTIMGAVDQNWDDIPIIKLLFWGCGIDYFRDGKAPEFEEEAPGRI